MTKTSNLNRILIAITVLGLAVLACGPTVVTTPEPTPITQQTVPNGQLSRADLIAATVQIFGSDIVNGEIHPIYVGSGSIISRDGLILTNAHVASPSSQGEQDPDLLVIGIVQAEDQPPVYSYLAEVRAADGYMDLAVIQITATLEGDSVDPSSLNLPYVYVGDSDQVHVGDHINIFGFPAIGGDTITYTDGNVSGFSPEDQLGDRAWIKTDATISGGNSGGMATNDQGQLIGVPTIAASGADYPELVDCRVVQDTNGDGVVDQNDTCIPLGGFINGLRPVNLARPLIQAAKSGQAYSSPYGGGQQAGPSGSGSEHFGPVAWFEVTRLAEPCEIGDQVNSYPSGTLGVVAAFDYTGMIDGESWATVWTVDGQTIFDSVYTWDAGASGPFTFCLSNGGDPLPDGTYHAEFYAGPDNMPLLTEGDMAIGSGQPAPPPNPQAGVQVFGTVYDKDTGNPINGAYIFVLNPGVNFDAWSQNGYLMSDVFTFAQTDSQGGYSLPDKLERNVAYTLVVTADGYLTTYGDDLVWTDTDPASYSMDIPLTK